jgi:dihydroflavonol-4-reductase
MADLTGLKAPATKLPVSVIRGLAAVMEFASKLTGKRPMLDRSQVDEFAGKYAYHSSEKAKRELGYTHLSARETLQRTITWLVQHGFVNEQRRALILKTLPA